MSIKFSLKPWLLEEVSVMFERYLRVHKKVCPFVYKFVGCLTVQEFNSLVDICGKDGEKMSRMLEETFGADDAGY